MYRVPRSQRGFRFLMTKESRCDIVVRTRVIQRDGEGNMQRRIVQIGVVGWNNLKDVDVEVVVACLRRLLEDTHSGFSAADTFVLLIEPAPENETFIVPLIRRALDGRPCWTIAEVDQIGDDVCRFVWSLRVYETHHPVRGKGMQSSVRLDLDVDYTGPA